MITCHFKILQTDDCSFTCQEAPEMPTDAYVYIEMSKVHILITLIFPFIVMLKYCL